MPNNLDYIRAYDKQSYDQIKIRVRKSERMPELLELAANKAGKSKQAYILLILKKQLDADGITIDMLPEMVEGSTEE